MGVRRRQPAGACVGGLADLPDRTARRGRRRRSRLPQDDLPSAAHELHLVGESQGCRRPQHLRGRLPRTRQHRRLRPERPPAGRLATPAVRCDELGGDLRPEDDEDRPRAGAARPRLRGPGDQVLPALPRDREGDDVDRGLGRRPLGRAGGVLLRLPRRSGGPAAPDADLLPRRPDPPSRGRDDRTRSPSPAAHLRRGGGAHHGESAGTRRTGQPVVGGGFGRTSTALAPARSPHEVPAQGGVRRGADALPARHPVGESRAPR